MSNVPKWSLSILLVLGVNKILVRASIHNGRAYVPAQFMGLMTDLMDKPSGWFPMSAEKMSKEKKIEVYSKLKKHPDWKELSRPQKMCAKNYIRKSAHIVMKITLACEAIIFAKRYNPKQDY